jgi:hypothetical protein
VLNCCVTGTNDTPCASNSSTSFGEVGQRPREAVDLVDDDHVDAATRDVLEESLQGRAFDIAAGGTHAAPT